MVRRGKADAPLSWPTSRFSGFHPSTFTLSEPHTFPFSVLTHMRAHSLGPAHASKIVTTVNTHGSRSQIITISSSLPLVSHLPECAHLTTSTGPVCIVSVHRLFSGRPESSEAWLRMGFVLQMRTFASSPPVAIREPSGCTWQENMETRLASPHIAEAAYGAHRCSFIQRSTRRKGNGPLCIIHDGFVNFMTRAPGGIEGVSAGGSLDRDVYKRYSTEK